MAKERVYQEEVAVDAEVPSLLSSFGSQSGAGMELETDQETIA